MTNGLSEPVIISHPLIYMRYISAHYIYPVSSPPLKNGIICVNDHGEIVDLIDTHGQLKETEKLEFYNGIIVPGFINAHCHLELSHLRNMIPPHTGLPGFLSSIGRIRPSEERSIIQSAKDADQEMLRNGIVAVGDISNQADTIPVKINSNIHYHTFIEVFGLDDTKADIIFNKARDTEKLFAGNNLRASIVPHAMYSVSETLFSLLKQYYETGSYISSIHHQESDEEITLYPKGLGALAGSFANNGLYPGEGTTEREIVKQMQNCLHSASGYLLVHNTFVTSSDIQTRLQQLPATSWVLCPCSNQYIQNRLPDISVFLDPSLNVCLGTDSLSSNTGLSILEEMKTIHLHYPEVQLDRIIKWATLNGAKALGMEQTLGSFDCGKKPGINLITGIDYDRLQLSGNSKVQVII